MALLAFSGPMDPDYAALTRSRYLRVLFTLTAFAVVWLVSTRARAAEASMAMSVHEAASSENASCAPPPAAPPPISPSTKAPLCDPRGATTYASAPQMQEVESTVDSGLTFEDCMPTAAGDSRHAAPGRVPLPIDAFSASSDAAVMSAVAKLARAASELLPAPGPSTPCFLPGYRSTVDRPPRTI
jgi:hypothetical protein